MTQQVPDRLSLDGETYTVVGLDGYLTRPADIGATPGIMSTICYRRYSAQYAVLHGQLILGGFRGDYTEPPPAVCGIEPTRVVDLGRFALYEYEGLEVACGSALRVLVGADPRKGAQFNPWPYPNAFERLVEIRLSNARVVQVIDHSQAIAAMQPRLDELLCRWEARDRRESGERDAFDEYRELAWSLSGSMTQQPPLSWTQDES
jgi:hypothetical protein